MPITFTSYKEAKEYSDQKEDEGYDTELKQVRHNVWKVSIIRRKHKPYEFAKGSYDENYEELKRTREHPQRSEDDIKKIAHEELRKAGITKPVKVIITQFELEESGIGADTGAGISDPKKDTIELYIHPYYQYAYAKDLKNIIRHEIEHIKEIQSVTEKPEEQKGV